jgi:hypothetical protein
VDPFREHSWEISIPSSLKDFAVMLLGVPGRRTVTVIGERTIGMGGLGDVLK